MEKELTWQDCRRIVMIADKMIDEDIEGDLKLAEEGEQAYYEEILRRFNEKKK